MLRSIGKQSGESAESVLKKKREAAAVKQSVGNVVALRGGGYAATSHSSSIGSGYPPAA